MSAFPPNLLTIVEQCHRAFGNVVYTYEDSQGQGRSDPRQALARWRVIWQGLCKSATSKGNDTPMDELYPQTAYDLRFLYGLTSNGGICPGYRSRKPHSSAWESLCEQVFEVSTDDDRHRDFLLRLGRLQPPISVSDGLKALAEASGLPDWTPSRGIKLEELQYYSIEAGSPFPPHSHLVGPRDSVEPMPTTGALRTPDQLHHGKLRMTDELHHGRMRMTDEAKLNSGPQRRTDSPHIKLEAMADYMREDSTDMPHRRGGFVG